MEQIGSCLFNVGVECGKKECSKCGFNPKNEKLRKDRIRRVLLFRKKYVKLR